MMSVVAPGTDVPKDVRDDVRGMFDRIAGRYDRANRIMSAGVDGLWRRKAIRALLAGLGDSPRVLDLGAGTLDGAIAISRRKPGALVVGADFARNMLAEGLKKPAPRRWRLRSPMGTSCLTRTRFSTPLFPPFAFATCAISNKR